MTLMVNMSTFQGFAWTGPGVPPGPVGLAGPTGT